MSAEVQALWLAVAPLQLPKVDSQPATSRGNGLDKGKINWKSSSLRYAFLAIGQAIAVDHSFVDAHNQIGVNIP